MDSATRPNAAYAGLLGLLLALPFLGRFARPVDAAAFAMAMASAPPMLVDILVNRVHLRPSAGLAWSGRGPANWARIGYKWLGLAGTLAVCWLAAWAFREYRDALYQPFFELAARYGPTAAGLAAAYVAALDRHLVEPHDGLYWAGRWFAGKWRGIPAGELGHYGRGALVKAFFFPLMFAALVDALHDLPAMAAALRSGSFVQAAKHSVKFLYFIDVAIVAPAYLLSLRLFDAHVRSAEPTAGGWLAALVCYHPFWPLLERGYLGYGDGIDWVDWLGQFSLAAQAWGCAVVALTGTYAWATVAIGYRFSNLTHRGIVSIGPYRWLAHPAYLAKNLAWWLSEVPWANPDPAVAAANCLKLGLLNLVYWLRAKTEERHLLSDPAYRVYLDALPGWPRLLASGTAFQAPKA